MSADIITLPTQTGGFAIGPHGRSFEADASVAARKLRDAVEAMRTARRTLIEASNRDRGNAGAVVRHVKCGAAELSELLADIEDELEDPTPEESLSSAQKSRLTGHPTSVKWLPVG